MPRALYVKSGQDAESLSNSSASGLEPNFQNPESKK
jgi:hypothetical protein